MVLVKLDIKILFQSTSGCIEIEVYFKELCCKIKDEIDKEFFACTPQHLAFVIHSSDENQNILVMELCRQSWLLYQCSVCIFLAMVTTTGYREISYATQNDIQSHAARTNPRLTGNVIFFE